MEKIPRATIDFETRSSADLLKVGAFRYAQNFDTRVLCLVYELPGREPKLWIPGFALPQDLFFWIEDGGMVEAHNAEFEWCIWNYILVKQKWPALPWTQLICSAAKAAVLGLPRKLGQLCDVLNTDVKKDMAGHQIMKRVSRLKKPSKQFPDFWDEDPEKLAKLYAYCEDDVRAEKAASEILPDLTPAGMKFYRLTQRINERGIYCDIASCRKAFEFAKRFEREYLKELRDLTNGKVLTVRQTEKIKEFLFDNGLTVPNLQAKTIVELLKLTNLTPKAQRLLEIRQILNKSSLSKFYSMIKMAGPDGRIRGTLLFNGASTGRDTGKGIQPQNMPRGNSKDVDLLIERLQSVPYEEFKKFYPNVFEALSNSLRGMLMAAPGKKLVAADFSAIETRVLFWLAGHKEGLQIFFDKGKIYEDMASSIYNLPIEEIDAIMRQLGKQAILALGYGMGAPKFVVTCAGYHIPITEEFSKKVVSIYREKHWPVPAYWHDTERAAIRAVKDPGRIVVCGKCKFFVKGRFLICELPSGRRLFYRDPLVREVETPWGMKDRLGYWGVNSTSKQWKYEETYGGKLVENQTQAVAADLMIEASGRHEMNNFPVILRVHDEDVAEVDEDRECLSEFEKIMEQNPKWAAGLPLEVKGWEGKRYRKA